MYQRVDESGVEVVAGADGAYGIYLRGLVGIMAVSRIHLYGSVGLGADKVPAERLYVIVENLAGIVGAVEIAEVVGRAAHYGTPAAVLLYVGQHLGNLVDVTLAEVDVVKQDGARIVSGFQKSCRQLPDLGVDGEKRAEEYDIALLETETADGLHISCAVILVELVLGVVVAVEKGHRKMGLSAGISDHAVGGYVVGFHEVDNNVADVVVAGLGDHLYAYPGMGNSDGASEADERIERAASGNRLLRLVVLENDIENGLAYAYYSSHF